MGSNPTPSAIAARSAPFVALLLLAACAVGVGGSASASDTPTSPVATAQPTGATAPPPTATPSLAAYESRARERIEELTDARCLVHGTGTFRPPDPDEYADRIARLPNREGWLQEPFIWTGTPEGLASALDGTLIGSAGPGAWFIYTDPDGRARAESFWRFPTDSGGELWVVKDSIASTPCESGGA